MYIYVYNNNNTIRSVYIVYNIILYTVNIEIKGECVVSIRIEFTVYTLYYYNKHLIN